MGTQTRGQLLQQAGLAAGNDQTTGFVRTWLDQWLHRTAKSWAWPTLKKQVYDLSAPAGSSDVNVGVGYNTKVKGVTNLTTWVHRIFSPLFIYSTDKKQRGRVTIRELIDGNVDIDPTATNTTDRTGMPTSVRIMVNGDGSMVLSLDPVPDKQYYLSFFGTIIPPNIGPLAADDAQIPWYQTDRTLTQACKCALLEADDGGESGAALEKEMQKLAAMVIDDRDFDGEGPGDNVVMGLDKSVFI